MMNIPTIVVVLTALMQQLPVTVSLRLEKANGCPQKFKHYESMCYGAVEKVISADPCKTAVGGDLATWHDQDTLDLISSLEWKSSKCGIGLEYSSGSWFWRNGEIMTAQSTFEEATTERSKYWSLEKTGGRSKATLAPASRYDFEDCSICQTRRVNTIYHDAAVYYPMDVWYQGKTFDAISGQYVGDQDARVDLVDSYADLGKALRPQSSADVFTLPPNTKPCSKDSCYESGTSIAFWVEMPPGSDSSEPESGQLDNFTCLVRTDGTSDYSNYSFCKYSANDAILTTGSETWSLFQDVVDASSSIWTFVVASWKGAEFRGCVWPEQLTCFVCHTFDICEGCMDLIHDGPLYFGWDRVSFDEFAVWNRPLSDAEIINLFNRSEPRLILDDASDISKLTDLIKSQEGLEADEATWILQSELSFVQADDTVTNADDLEVINELFATTLESHNTEDVMHSELLENLQIALDIVSELTRDERGHLWSLKSNKTQIVPCPCSLTTSVGDFANNIGQALLLMNVTDRTYIVTSKRAAAQITPVTELQDEYDEDDDLVISLKTNSSAVTSSKHFSPDVEVSIPVKVVKEEEAVLVVVVVYDNLHDIFPARDNSTFYTPSNVSTEVDLPREIKFVASSVIDVTFIPAPTTSVTFDTPIVFVFELESHQFRNASKYDKFTRLCVYWNTSYTDKKTVGAWATNGCEMTDSNNTHVTCSCYHLTHFAVLMIREPGKIGDGHVRALTILSNIGCSLSVFGSVSTVAAFIILRMNTDRVLIHSNLASSIAMSQILFLAQGSLQPMTVGCKVMAGVMYYFFSSSFVWMMIEGLQLYTQVVLVFNQESSKMRYYVVAGWGIPLVMTGIVIGSTLESIGRRTDACWLDYSDNSIYFFVIPTLCVVIANMAILTRVTMVIVNLKNHDQLKRDDATYQKLKYALKASLTISPLMGSTWMFGVLTLADSSNLTFLYIFVLCNSIQGLLIFILHCLNSQEVRDAFKRRMEVYNIGRSIRRFKIQPTSSSMNDSVIQDEKVFRSTINTLSSVVSKEQKTH